MEPEERIACNPLGGQFRVTPICVPCVRKIGVGELGAKTISIVAV